MIQLTPQMRILVGVEPVDFRAGIDGLCRLCRQAQVGDPFSGTVFVFRNRRATAIKVLAYDGQGFWLCQKLRSGFRRAISATGRRRLGPDNGSCWRMSSRCCSRGAIQRQRTRYRSGGRWHERRREADCGGGSAGVEVQREGGRRDEAGLRAFRRGGTALAVARDLRGGAAGVLRLRRVLPATVRDLT